ncbi:hypothetical protein F8388_024559 [Cannabis sativa]|uniref:Leucine-rich repeat-containing N-terminal plant-type domain-containing protein n=1 Tax=Cannabis sativa TaxID=3483 RepID=A0A7J6GBD6_CANSA|nr:hypothetical protein F8388_024559 [Cannabis sativa]
MSSSSEVQPTTTTHTSFKRNPNDHVLCIESEKQALLSLKKDLVDPFNKLISWVSINNGSNDDDCCKWTGIVCDISTGHVKQLRLVDASLSGKVNPSLLNLTHLTHLDLSQNDFKGTRIPPFIGSLMSLKYLNLTMAGFDGKIPHQLGNLSSLTHLSLRSTISSFFNPDENEILSVDNLHWLSGLSSLQSLVMDQVNLSKASNHWLFAMNTIPSLREIRLSSCELSHIHFPSHINLTSLETLDLSYNSIELREPIPCTFPKNMTLLKYLDLSGNNIDSVIPNCFYSFPNLEHLNLFQTKLHGIISSDVANLTSIVSLDLSGNALEGKIPTSMGKLCNLEEFDLTGNNYEGSVSMVFESLSGCLAKKLKSLNLGANSFDSFTGQILDGMRHFKNLHVLDLGNNKFSGPIPLSIFGNLISLKSLDLSSNNFSGPLPDFPASLSNLESLSIYLNKLSGSIPKSLQSLSKLKHLSISNNQLSGSLPISLGSLANLEDLLIESNDFKGHVSEVHFANLTKLKFVLASGNKLSMKVGSNWAPPFSLEVMELRNWNLGPHFPQWLKSQKNISQIDISNTGISGVIPQWFWNNLFSNRSIMLDISKNQIYGEIPNFPNNVSFLVLNMSFNKLTGPLPRIPISKMLDLSNNYLSVNISNFLCDPTSYQREVLSINLKNNFLSGKIPDCWMYWSTLKIIDLDNNNLNGIIPRSIGFLRNLESLHLRNNSFVGEVPESLKNCSALIGLDLGLNKLVGTIPRWIGSLPWLGLLVLRSNNLTGLIPTELCKLFGLQILDASNNNLMGKIPKCFKNLSSMTSKSNQYLSSYYFNIGDQEAGEYASVVVKGRESQYNTILYLLCTLDLSRNNLSGEIPEELASLDALQSLNLSGNYLSGSIPEKIDSMTDLESLDLSRNHLSGYIPTGLSGLSFLSHLNLSYNNLSGQIPIGTQLQSMDASSFVGNKLCGPPLKKCIEDPHTTHPDASNDDGEREDDEYWFRLGIGMGFGVSFLSLLVPLVVCGFWRRAYFWFFEEYLWNKILDYLIKIKYIF